MCSVVFGPLGLRKQLARPLETSGFEDLFSTAAKPLWRLRGQPVSAGLVRAMSTEEEYDLSVAIAENWTPRMRELMGQLEALLASGPDRFRDCEVMFQSIANSEVLTGHYNGLISGYLSNPTKGIVGSNVNGLVIASSKYFSLTAMIFRKEAEHLYLYPSHAFTTVLGSDVVSYRKYSIVPKLHDIGVFSEDHSLNLIDEGEISAGRNLFRNGCEDVIDFRRVSGRPAMLLRLLSPRLGALQWAFDRTTMRPWQAFGVDGVTAQLCSLIGALAALKSPASVDPLISLTSHEYHFVRWEAVKALGKIDRSAALAGVARLVDDPHPDVRGAAVRTLKRQGAV